MNTHFNYILNKTYTLYIIRTHTHRHMDAKKRIQRKPILKPKVSHVEQPIPSNTEPVVVPTPANPTPKTTEPVVPPSNPTTEPAPETQPEGKPKGTRTQTNKAINISISAARVRRHIDKLNLNAKLDALIAEPRAQLLEHKLAKEQLESRKIKKSITKTVDDKEVTTEEIVDMTAEDISKATATVAKYSEQTLAELKAKVDALSRERTRFSDGASMILAIVCDELVQQLVNLAMKQVLADEKKIVQVAHLHKHNKPKGDPTPGPAPGIESISLYPLISTLPLFKETAKKYDDEEKCALAAKVEKALRAQAEKDFKKKYNVRIQKKKAVDPATTNGTVTEAGATTNGTVVPGGEHTADTAAGEPVNTDPAPASEVATEEIPPETDEEEGENDTKTSFKYYIYQICKELTKSNTQYAEIRTSPVFREHISLLLIELIQRICPLISLTAKSMGNKTVNDLAILRTIEGLLIDGHQPQETIDLGIEMVPDPVILGAEKIKSADAKKNKVEYKFDIDAIPKVSNGLKATRTVVYPTSGYGELYTKIEQKMKIYNAL